MAIAGTNIQLDSTEGMDKITSTEKVTTPYHSNGSTELAAANIVTSSQTGQATNEKYFFGIANSDTSTVAEWNVAFGSTNGYGHNVEANTKSESEVIYKQFAGMLLAPTEVTGGFIISSAGSSGAVSSGKDEEIYILTAKRSNMKDRINKGNWTIALSGSNSADDAGITLLELTDDSVNSSPTSTPVGDRYNIVSGALGTTITGQEATVKTYGHFYPDVGVLVFSAQELSASIPGKTDNIDDVVQFGNTVHNGFGYSQTTNADSKQALRFINCLKTGDAKLSFRDEEDQVSAQYFCRVKSGHMNFSNNPTFVSGSLNELRATKMKGDPQTFITSVQLYNAAGDIVAVGNLSTPLKKNFSSEATIKVKLTY